MKFFLRSFGSLSFFCFALFLSGCKEEKDPSVLHVVSCIDYVPFEFHRGGEYVGFDIDLIKLVAKKLNLSVKIKDLPFESLLGALQTGKTDLAISSISNTEERRKVVDFSIDYYSSGHCLLLLDKASIESLKDTKGSKIGVQAGTVFETFLKKNGKKKFQWALRSMEKIPDLIQELHTNRIDGIMMGDAEARALVETNPDFKTLPVPGEKASFAIAFPKGSALVKKVNAILREFEDNGTMEILKNKWLRK